LLVQGYTIETICRYIGVSLTWLERLVGIREKAPGISGRATFLRAKGKGGVFHGGIVGLFYQRSWMVKWRDSCGVVSMKVTRALLLRGGQRARARKMKE
jgi:hypothetical protein